MVNEKKKCIENVNKMVEAEVTTRSSSTQAYTSVTKVVIYDRRILILRLAGHLFKSQWVHEYALI